MQNMIPEPFRGFLLQASPVGITSLEGGQAPAPKAHDDAFSDMVFLATILSMYDTGDDYDWM